MSFIKELLINMFVDSIMGCTKINKSLGLYGNKTFADLERGFRIIDDFRKSKGRLTFGDNDENWTGNKEDWAKRIK